MTEQAKQTIKINEQQARIKELESALTALREEREQLMKENKELLTRRDSEGDSPRQPAAPTAWRDSRGYMLPTYLAVVEDEDGAGVQIEGHVKGQDWEIDVDAAGRLHGFLCVPPLEESQSADARLTPVAEGKASGSATDRDLRDLRTQVAHLTEEREGLKAEIAPLQHELLFYKDTNQHHRKRAEKAETELAALTEAHERLIAKRTPIRSTLAVIDAFRGDDSDAEWADCLHQCVSDDLNVTNAFARAFELLRECADEFDALLSPREGTQLLEDQERTDDLARVDTKADATDSRTAGADKG